MDVNWHDRENELEQLAYMDESADYEVDQTGIYWDPKTKDFVLMTASGCSCWCGEAEEEHYPTLDALELSLLGPSDRTYNPSLNGAEWLIAEARKSYNK